MEDLHLVQWLRKIQTTWELELQALSRVSHIPETTLQSYLAMSPDEITKLPTVPAELSHAVPLVSLFKRIQETYPDPKEQNFWLKTSNSVLEGQVPVDAISISPSHLAYVSYVVESGIRLQ
jgi:hypothetical protein